MLVYVVTLENGKNQLLFHTQQQRTSALGYVSLIAVQNGVRLSGCGVLGLSK